MIPRGVCPYSTDRYGQGMSARNFSGNLFDGHVLARCQCHDGRIKDYLKSIRMEVHMTEETHIASLSSGKSDGNMQDSNRLPLEDAEKKTLIETIQMACDVIGEAHETARWFQSPDTECYLMLALDYANNALKAFQRDFVTAEKKRSPTIGYIKGPPIKKRKSRKPPCPEYKQFDEGDL